MLEGAECGKNGAPVYRLLTYAGKNGNYNEGGDIAHAAVVEESSELSGFLIGFRNNDRHDQH